MVFSYNWLQSFFKQKLPSPQKLAGLLTLHFAEVEEIKRKGRDFVLNIDVRPNRAPDCFSYIGVAREISGILGLKYQEPANKFKDYNPPTASSRKAGPSKNLKAKDFVSIEVNDKNACPRYTAKVITGVKVGSSPKWLKERLKVCGLRPINNIVDIANYVMLETGQPLHAFDGEKLAGQRIIVRLAKAREKIVTLDEQKFDLDPEILVIADEKKPIAIAGVKGGKLPEIGKKTKIVVLESANFNPQVVRRGSKKLNLKTDASIRFEHGIDPNLTETAIKRTCHLIERIAKGKTSPGLLDVYSQKVFPKVIKLDLDYLDDLLGVKVPEKEVKNIFGRLAFKIKSKKGKLITVEVPTRRLDISIPEDLIEEVGRIYGYQKIPATFPISTLIPPKRNLDIFWEDLTKDILKEAGFAEVYNYSFFSEKEARLFGYKEKDLIELENPLSGEQQYLRASLIPNLLKNLEKNQRRFPKIKIFESGKIFKNEKLESEKRMLTGLIAGEEFYQLKGVIDLLLSKLGISNVWYDEYKATPEETKLSVWHPKKCAEIKVNNEEIGFLGEISPRILGGSEISGKVVVFDIDFEKLAKLTSEEHEYRPISKFPAAVRDIAILVPRQVRVEEVLNKIETVGGEIIRDIDLFDIYEGEELPMGKKNLAFHIIYQAEDRTLSSKEIDEIQKKIIKALGEKPGWQVRK